PSAKLQPPRPRPFRTSDARHICAADTPPKPAPPPPAHFANISARPPLIPKPFHNAAPDPSPAPSTQSNRARPAAVSPTTAPVRSASRPTLPSSLPSAAPSCSVLVEPPRESYAESPQAQPRSASLHRTAARPPAARTESRPANKHPSACPHFAYAN